MFKLTTILVPVLFVAQCALVHWAGHAEMRPAPPNPASFPTEFAGWHRIMVDPSSTEQAATLKTGALLNWTYIHPHDGSLTSATLLVAWFSSQRDGDAFVHRPEVCLPGSGWNIQSTNKTKIDAADGAISATRDVIAKREDRQVVLYWYQTPKRAAADLWELKFGLAVDLITERRSDVALVRVATRSDEGTESATRVAVGFARSAFPLLRSWLPR